MGKLSRDRYQHQQWPKQTILERGVSVCPVSLLLDVPNPRPTCNASGNGLAPLGGLRPRFLCRAEVKLAGCTVLVQVGLFAHQ